jgi:hypothetical protein
MHGSRTSYSHPNCTTHTGTKRTQLITDSWIWYLAECFPPQNYTRHRQRVVGMLKSWQLALRRLEAVKNSNSNTNQTKQKRKFQIWFFTQLYPRGEEYLLLTDIPGVAPDDCSNSCSNDTVQPIVKIFSFILAPFELRFARKRLRLERILQPQVHIVVITRCRHGSRRRRHT